MYLRPCPRQHRRLHRRHRSNYHGYQSPARCNARCYRQPSSFTWSYRLSGKSEQPCGYSKALREGHALTAAQARISCKFGHRALIQRHHVQHRMRLRHDQYTRKLSDGGDSRGRFLQVHDGEANIKGWIRQYIGNTPALHVADKMHTVRSFKAHRVEMLLHPRGGRGQHDHHSRRQDLRRTRGHWN